MGDAEESADLIDYYCGQVEEANGFVRPMGRITPIERNTDVLRPVRRLRLHRAVQLSPGALGRDVVGRAHGRATPWCTSRPRTRPGPACELVRDLSRRRRAGRRVQLPAGAAREIGDAAVAAPRGRRRGVHRLQAGGHADPRRAESALDQAVPAGAGRQERGDGASRSADLDAAAEGVMRSAFSLQNQKCSATSRVYVRSARWRRRSWSGWSRRPGRSGWAIPPSVTSSSAR